MPSTWEPRFDFYMARIDSAPASFVIDMAAQPAPTHGVRLQVRTALLRPREDGLRDASELDAMGKIEDQIVERLEARLDALYVGRFVHAGYTTFVFYIPADTERIAREGLPDLVGDLGGYEPEWLTEPDAEWAFFLEFMFPDVYSMQSMSNRALLEQIRASGDQVDVPRTVDHLAYFPTRGAAEQAAASLRAAGFATDEVAENEEAFSLEFHREDALGGGNADAFCQEILDVILPLEGAYDGWGSRVVKG